MYVTRVPNRGSPPAILLRESYRDDGKVKTRTLANLSRWPEHKVDDAAARAQGPAGAAWIWPRRLRSPAACRTGMWPRCWAPRERWACEELIDPTPSRKRDLVMAMLVAQVIAPGSKLAIARGLRAETATSSLGAGAGGRRAVMRTTCMRRWTGCWPAKTPSKTRLAARHLANGTLVLYDVSSAAFEGRTCPLGKIGHARDGVKGRLQIVYGLLCTTAGVPVAIEVFEGNTADPKTLAAQITKLKTRFGLSRVVPGR